MASKSTKQNKSLLGILQRDRSDSALEGFIKGSAPGKREEKAVKYETNLVAFLDILGFVEKVNEKGENEPAMLKFFQSVVQIREYARERIIYYKFGEKIRMLALSDCIVLVCDEEKVTEFVKLISAIIHHAMISEEPFLIRGGITYGKVLVENVEEAMQIIGPAYSEAYILQENVAEYPRVAIDREAKKKIEGGVGKEFVSTCVDGVNYLNFVKVLEKLNCVDIKGFCDTASKKLREESDLKGDSIKTANVVRKYSWIINYLEGETWQKHT